MLASDMPCRLLLGFPQRTTDQCMPEEDAESRYAVTGIALPGTQTAGGLQALKDTWDDR